MIHIRVPGEPGNEAILNNYQIGKSQDVRIEQWQRRQEAHKAECT